MLFDPAKWLASFMELTEMSLSFKLIILVLGGIGFGAAFFAERTLFLSLAQSFRRIKKAALKSTPRTKARKRYKTIVEAMNDG